MQLIMPMPIMIWAAIIVEAAIGNWIDMIILLIIQFVNASIGWCGNLCKVLIIMTSSADTAVLSPL
jgi:hypothetical protein